MNKRTLILTITILTLIVSATTIALVVVFYPKDDDQEQQSKTIEELLAGVYQANTSQELGTYFSISFKLQVSMDYLFYVIERFKFHYGIFHEAQKFEIGSSLYYYQVVMENGNITGTIGVTFSNLISTFYILFGPFFESYLNTLELEDLTNEFFNLPDGGQKSLLLTRDTTILYNVSTTEKQSVASIFKLYVLKALSEKINNDSLIDWNTEIPIIDKLKSLPSGEMHTWVNGTMVSLETLAEYMIKISDNTATDHLIHYLTREYVEEFLPSDYSLPLLKTADVFKLRYLVSDGDLSTYLAMDPMGKRTYLDDVIFELNINDIYSIVDLDFWENIDQEKEVEWFFTTTQIAQVLNEVKDLNATRKNPGLAFSNQWKAIAYKGGGNFGVLTFAHALQATNDTWFTLVIFVNNYIKPEFDSYTLFEFDIQLICIKLIMHLALI